MFTNDQNWDPTDPNNSNNDSRIDPFPSDPAAGFHNYTLRSTVRPMCRQMLKIGLALRGSLTRRHTTWTRQP
jgi:hypothetical protein